MAELQSSDGDIGPLYRATANHQGRPDYQELRGGSLALKPYWAELKRLEMHDNLLYRRWEDDTGDITRLQVIVPFRYQRDICKTLHGPAGASHQGRRRTHDLIMRQKYWY